MSAPDLLLAWSIVSTILAALPIVAWRRWARRRAAERQWEHDAAVRAAADAKLAKVKTPWLLGYTYDERGLVFRSDRGQPDITLVEAYARGLL